MLKAYGDGKGIHIAIRRELKERRMKTIIAGGRNNHISPDDVDYLDSINITEVVSGGASGIDGDGEVYAKCRRLPCKVFKADWDKHGKAAGPIRNREMAKYADAVVLFSGGRGTANMLTEAKKHGLEIYDRRSA